MFRTTARKRHRILDFDLENRPLSYWYADATTAEVTAIAWSWADEDDVEVAVLHAPPDHLESRDEMLHRFVRAYDAADMVTGHYIRRHDLPILNAALLEAGHPTLSSKMTQDTKLELIKRGDLATSQEALGAMFGLEFPKVQMTQEDWREANRLTPEGILRTIDRVVGDVKQHKALRLTLLSEGLLKPPTLWSP